MTIRLSSLSAVMLFAVIGAVLWMLRQGAASSVVVIDGDDAETVEDEIEFPWLGG